jgi:hypothetical protein
LGCETDRYEDNIAAEQLRDAIQPVETLSHFVDQRAPVALSQLPVDLANSAQIEQPLPYLSLADGGKADLVQKQCANPSDHETRPQQPDGVVMWTDLKIEEGFLRNMRAIWYRIQAQWMEVRQLPGLNGMLSVVQYNKLINAIARKFVENDVLIHDDVVILQNQYKRVARQALHTLSSRSDRNLVRLLRRYMNRLHDKSQMVKLIMDHPMKDDEEDVDYRPAKRRRC